MKEEYLHFAYDKRMLGNQFQSTEKKQLTIVEFGELNVNAGPDFLDAKIEYDGQIWAGAIEFHVKGSDWFRHQHQNDPAYGTVIAHFVYENDQIVSINDFKLPTVELKTLIDSTHYKKYRDLLKTKKSILCEKNISNVDKFVVQDQKLESLHQRFWHKSIRILEDLETVNGDRSAAYLLVLARSFGGQVNRIPFEQVAAKIQLQWLAKMNYDPFRIEALLLGIGGFLKDYSDEEYVKLLQDEYSYQARLFGLSKSVVKGWKYARMRPANFPDRRLAQFAHFIAESMRINGNAIHLINSTKPIDRNQFCLDPFWATHYRIKKSTTKKIGLQFPDSIFDQIEINSIIPFNYALGLLDGNKELRAASIERLRFIAAEKNTIVRDWEKVEVSIESAFDTQALLALTKQSCIRKKCLFCSIGKSILNK